MKIIGEELKLSGITPTIYHTVIAKMDSYDINSTFAMFRILLLL